MRKRTYNNADRDSRAYVVLYILDKRSFLPRVTLFLYQFTLGVFLTASSQPRDDDFVIHKWTAAAVGVDQEPITSPAAAITAPLHRPVPPERVTESSTSLGPGWWNSTCWWEGRYYLW